MPIAADRDSASLSEARPGAQIIKDIEVLRGVAIGMVLLEHLPINLLWWRSPLVSFLVERWHGAMGVDLFFVISGFVIARGLLPKLAAANSSDDITHILRSFWIRRAFRLLPAAWLWLAIPLLASAWMGAHSWLGTYASNSQMFAYGVFNLANIYMAVTFKYAIAQLQFYGPWVGYWSLSLEEQFYLLLPIAAILFRHRLPWLLIAAVIYQFVVPFTALTDFTRPGALAIGVLIAIATRQPWFSSLQPNLLARSALLRGGLLLGCVAVLGWLGVDSNSWKLGSVAIISGLLVGIAAFDCDAIWPERRTRSLMIWLGSRSYALYLVHIPTYFVVAASVREIFGVFPPHSQRYDALAIMTAVGTSLLIAEMTHRLVEAPGRRFGRRLSTGQDWPPPPGTVVILET